MTNEEQHLVKQMGELVREQKVAANRVLTRPEILDEAPPADGRKRERWLHERELAERRYMEQILAKDANRMTGDELQALTRGVAEAARLYGRGELE